MHVLLTVIAIGGCFFIADRLCLWLERKGWLYYRNSKTSGGFIGSALLELQNIVNPSTRHTIEMKQNVTISKHNENDDASKKDFIRNK